MKSKAYFGPIIIRGIAVLLLLLSLAYAGLTAYDVLRAPSAPKGGTQTASTSGQKAQADAAEAARKAREKNTATVADAMEGCRAENGDWYTCKTDAECHTVIGVCGTQDTVNRQFTAQAAECYRAAGADTACPPFERARGSGACVKGVCVLKPAKISAPVKRETFIQRTLREGAAFRRDTRKAAPEER